MTGLKDNKIPEQKEGCLIGFVDAVFPQIKIFSLATFQIAESSSMNYGTQISTLKFSFRFVTPTTNDLENGILSKILLFLVRFQMGS